MILDLILWSYQIKLKGHLKLFHHQAAHCVGCPYYASTSCEVGFVNSHSQFYFLLILSVFHYVSIRVDFLNHWKSKNRCVKVLCYFNSRYPFALEIISSKRYCWTRRSRKLHYTVIHMVVSLEKRPSPTFGSEWVSIEPTHWPIAVDFLSSPKLIVRSIKFFFRIAKRCSEVWKRMT